MVTMESSGAPFMSESSAHLVCMRRQRVCGNKQQRQRQQPPPPPSFAHTHEKGPIKSQANGKCCYVLPSHAHATRKIN